METALRNFTCGFICIILAGIACAQDLSPDELKYEIMMEDILSGGRADSVIGRMMWDSLDKIDYYISLLPVRYAEKAVSLLDEAEDLAMRGRFAHRLGVMYINTGYLDLSLFHTKEAIRCFREAGERGKEAGSHGLLRYLYTETQAYDSSMYHCYQAMQIYEELNDMQGIGETYNDMAGTLISAGKYQDALAFAEKGIPILERGNSLFEYVLIKDKKAQCLFKLGNRAEALEVITEAFALADTIDPTITPVVAANMLQTRIGFYMEMQDYDKALEDIRLSNMYLKSVRSDYWQRVNDLTMADIYVRQKKFDAAKAMHLAMLILPDVDSSSYFGDLETNCLKLSEIYHALSMHDSAYYYLKLSNQLSRTQMANASLQQMEALKTQYETEQKEQLIASQESRIRQQKRVQMLSWLLSGLLVLGLGSVAILLLANKRRSKELELTNRKLDTRNAQNEVLLREIHHRVKNNLQTVSSLLNLQSDTITDQAALEAVGDSQHRVRSMALIHQKLYLHENLATIDMLDYFQSMGESILQSFGSRAALINYKVEMENLELDIDTAIPIGLITNELVTNSLKHAFPQGRQGNVTVKLTKGSGEELVLSVSDDGVGSDSTSPSGSGFGNRLVELLAMQLDGRLVRSFRNGMEVSLYFPQSGLLQGRRGNSRVPS